MANDPDPQLALSDLTGTTRTLTEWSTIFHLCLVVLPDRREGALWIPVARRIFATFGGADCHTAYVVPNTAAVARRILGDAADEALVFVDPERSLVRSLGLVRLPAFVHLRQDTTLGPCAEGWDPREWQRAAREIAEIMAWTTPDLADLSAPRPTPGWEIVGT